jgi:DNA-binding transcriptional MerR regulator
MKINEFAKRLGVSIQTVKLWQKKGYIPDNRDEKGHRVFELSDIKIVNRVKRNNTIMYPLHIVRGKKGFEI